MKSFIKFIVNSYAVYDLNRLARAISYNALFSIAPIFLLILKFLSPFLKSTEIEQVIAEQLGQVIGEQFTDSYISNIDKLDKFLDFGEVFTILAFIFIAISAISFLEEIKHALNVIFDVKKERKLSRKLKNMLAGFVGILILTIFLIAFVIFEAYANYFAELALFSNKFTVDLLRWLNILINAGLLTVLFAITFKYLPDIRIKKRFALLGGFVTALLFLLGQILISVYFSNYLRAESYAFSASLIIFLLWVYYCSQIFMLGGLVTKYLAGAKFEKV